MAQRKFIVLGDTTSHGGTVITANGRMTIDGKPVACVGDKVVCPRCKGMHVILGSGKKTTLDGKEMACEGDPVSDGSYLMAIHQSRATHEVDSSNGVSAAAAYQAAVADMAKQQVDVKRAAEQAAAAADDDDFCLTCWLKSAGQRGILMPGGV